MADSTVVDGQRKRALSLLDEGKALARSGDREGAREILRRVIQTEPGNVDAWLYLTYVSEGRERAAILREAQAFVPGDERLQEAVLWAEGEQAGAQPAATLPEETAQGFRLFGRRAGADASAHAQGQPVAGPTWGERAAAAKESARQWAWQMDDAARAAQERVSHSLGRAREGMQLPQMQEPRPETPRLETPRPGTPRLETPRLETPRLEMRRVSLPILTLVAVAALTALVFLGIAKARQGGAVVQAMVLPTMMPEATATPSLDQRTSNLWVQVDVAWTRQDWDEVVTALERIRAIDPYSEEARARLAEAYFNRGAQCIDENRLDDAKRELDIAIRMDASSENLQEMRRQLQAYMSGLDAYWAQDWETAVQVLRKLYKRNPHFRDTEVMLGQSYYKFGITLQDGERWDEAETAYMYAVDMAPELEDAKVRLQYVRDVITPPKRIEVSISKKRVTLFENHKPIREYLVCTGRPTAVTLPGRYSVLDKMPEAYASKWDLWMPWWLGIYWAGGSENGFHALPILSNGRVLWSGALGTGCSFGCIVLDTADAKFMYDWAEIGDVVLVHP